MITKISYEDILPIWSMYLWPSRKDIKSMSSMLYNRGYDIEIYNLYRPIFLAYELDGIVMGVNSGHPTSRTDYRSRGLYVFPEYRGQGIGTKLLKETMEVAKANGYINCWSVPRKTALKSYLNAGFIQTSEFIKTETSDENCYVLATLNV